MKIKLIKSVAIFMTWFAFSALAHAESSKEAGDYVIHYNVLSTESIPARVAQSYGIKRSKSRGFLNVSVLKKGAGFEGVEAKVSATAVNLSQQLRQLDIRKVTEKNAIYYISDFSVSDQETLSFKINVTTADNKTTEISLKQQFFTK